MRTAGAGGAVEQDALCGATTVVHPGHGRVLEPRWGFRLSSPSASWWERLRRSFRFSFSSAIVATVGTATDRHHRRVDLPCRFHGVRLAGRISGQELYGLVLAAVLAVLSIAASWYRIRSAEEEYRRRSTRRRSPPAAVDRRRAPTADPPPAARTGVGLIVDGHYRPVEENQMVGGDICEVVVPFRGKGDDRRRPRQRPARGRHRVLRPRRFPQRRLHIKDLIQLADVLDTSVVRYNIYAKQVQETERFVTALLIDIDDQGRVRVIN